MIKKTFFLSLLAFTAFFLFTQTPHAEARGHHHRCKSTSVNVAVGTAYNDAYVVRRYPQPMVVRTPARVYAPVVYAQPCLTPTYVYAVQPVVEEVYVAPAPRSLFDFAGLSFSWNFFK